MKELERLLENKILRFIQQNPGCHLRKIKVMMHISLGTTQYHLDRLEKMGRIASTRLGLYKHYFPIGIFRVKKEILKFEVKERHTRDSDAHHRTAIAYPDRHSMKKCGNISGIG